jgi:nickel transport protein
MFPALVFGHGVEVYDISAEDIRARMVYFKYSTSEPVSFAKIKLYPPSTRDKNIESLVSITDRNGYFSFIPDETGEWRIDMEDGMGHKGTINVTVSDENATADTETDKKTSSQRVPLAVAIVLGLSLLANIFTVWSLIIRGAVLSWQNGRDGGKPDKSGGHGVGGGQSGGGGVQDASASQAAFSGDSDAHK